MHTVASRLSRSHGRTCGSQRCRNNLKFPNTKHSVKYIEKCIALDATHSCTARPGASAISCATQQIAEQHKSAYPILNRMPPLAHNSQHSTWALVSGCRCCKLALTLTCTLWPVACQGAMAVHAVQQRCRNNLKFPNTKHSVKYIEKCIADATHTVASHQVQVDNQLCHTANCNSIRTPFLTACHHWLITAFHAQMGFGFWVQML